MKSPVSRLERIRALCRRYGDRRDWPEKQGSPPRKQRFPRMRGIRAVLFDVYGTVLGSAKEEGRYPLMPPANAVRMALRAASFRLLRRDAGQHAVERVEREIQRLHRKAGSNNSLFPEIDIRDIWRTVLRRLIRERQIQGRLTEQAVSAVAVEYECLVNPVRPLPGIGSVFSAFKARKLLMGGISNAQFYTPLQLAAFPETRGFWNPDLCIWSFQYKVAKPSRELFRVAVKKLAKQGIGPGQVLFVGNDPVNDIRPARQCGFRTALFLSGARLRTMPARQRRLIFPVDGLFDTWIQFNAWLERV